METAAPAHALCGNAGTEEHNATLLQYIPIKSLN